MNESSNPSFWRVAWGVVAADIKPSMSHWTRYVSEAVFVGVPTWFALSQFGSKDAPLDSLIERFAVGGALLAVPFAHIAWSIATVPWRLYCEQRCEISTIRDLVQTGVDRVAATEAKLVILAHQGQYERRVELAREAIIKKAEELKPLGFKPDIVAWSHGARAFLQQTMLPELANRFQLVSFAHNGPFDPEDIQLLQKADASLRAIAVTLEAKHLLGA